MNPKTGFQKGNKLGTGRPKLPEEFKQLAKDNAVAALKKLIEFMDDESIDDRVRVEACKTIMDRAYGKPTQSVDLDISTLAEYIQKQKDKYK